ncbi:hypothetical protein FOL47_009595 [Perkinsus chesapeaki]|uniref:Uncharacterized protein n=1 Tax=Perkinsus chesapeaki TaxID=330153 RepID=A0A7J6MRG7_PERCH|nr:hypothetical protein FOL47_009595 [Perkinsus chesapeaki]
MKSPGHVLALEVSVFMELMQRRGRDGVLSGVFKEFCNVLRRRELALSYVSATLLLTPPPVFIFIMNDELYGVYPTPTGLNIRKPLVQGDEGVVLQPGFEGKGIYYYHTIEYRLFVLCEDNRELIIYDIQATDRPGQVSEVSGMPDPWLCRSRKLDMAANTDFIYILTPLGDLFYIDRQTVHDTVEAYRGWRGCYNPDRCERLVLNPSDPRRVRVLVLGYFGINIVDLRLVDKGGKRCFEELSEVPWPGAGQSYKLMTVVPLEYGILGMVYRTASRYSNRRSCELQLVDSSSRRIGFATKVAEDHREVSDMEVICGFGDVVYVLRRDTSFRVQRRFIEAGDDESVSSIDTSVSEMLPLEDPMRLTVYHTY